LVLTRQNVQTMVNAKAGKPFAQRNFLNTLRVAFQWAVDEGRLPDDPTLGVKRPKTKTDGYRTWSEDEIARFEAHHAIGTKARLAFDLLLNTGQRRGDVVRMGPQHLQPSPAWPQGLIVFNQGKTKTPLMIPVHPQLRASIDATPSGHLSFLVTHQGQPYVAAGFGNWFREQCDAAGCPDVSAHGLRKATATRRPPMQRGSDQEHPRPDVERGGSGLHAQGEPGAAGDRGDATASRGRKVNTNCPAAIPGWTKQELSH
jgi:integrase